MSDIQLFESTTPGMSYEALYILTWNQIQKDFAHFCQTPELIGTPSPEDMLQAILQMLTILSPDAQKLNSLFYRIDLSEHTKIPQGNMQTLALMILKREAQKVWIRANYSSPKN